jgi:hypothetical protein
MRISLFPSLADEDNNGENNPPGIGGGWETEKRMQGVGRGCPESAHKEVGLPGEASIFANAAFPN